jgi:hypothetical protein
VRLEGLGKLKKSSDLILIRTRNLPVCSIVPQPTTLWYTFLFYWLAQNSSHMPLLLASSQLIKGNSFSQPQETHSSPYKVKDSRPGEPGLTCTTACFTKYCCVEPSWVAVFNRVSDAISKHTRRIKQRYCTMVSISCL